MLWRIILAGSGDESGTQGDTEIVNEHHRHRRAIVKLG